MFGLNKAREIKIRERELDFVEKQFNMVLNQLSGFTTRLTQNANNQSIISEGYQTNATVFSIIDLLVKSGSCIPAVVYKVKDSGAMKEYKAMTSGFGNGTSYTKASILKERSFEPVENDLSRLLENPNQMMGYAEFIQEVLGFKYLTGNSFIYGPKRSGTGKISSLNVWPAQYVNILTNRETVEIMGYSVIANDWSIQAEKDEIGHIKNFNPDYNRYGSHYYGQSPLAAAYSNLTINNDAIATGSNIIKQQGTRGMVVPDGERTMYDKETAQALEKKYIEKHTLQGRHGMNSGILWPSLAMKWVNMSLPAGDLALLEQYNTSIKDLCGIYKVPSILLNDTAESKVESYREAKKHMYQQGVFPEMIALRDELNRWLTPSYGKDLFIDFDFMSVPEIQEDMEKVTDQLYKAWWITGNEKRAVQKYPRSEDELMDKFLVPANLLDLSDNGISGELEGGKE